MFKTSLRKRFLEATLHNFKLDILIYCVRLEHWRYAIPLVVTLRGYLNTSSGVSYL